MNELLLMLADADGCCGSMIVGGLMLRLRVTEALPPGNRMLVDLELGDAMGPWT